MLDKEFFVRLISLLNEFIYYIREKNSKFIKNDKHFLLNSVNHSYNHL